MRQSARRSGQEMHGECELGRSHYFHYYLRLSKTRFSNRSQNSSHRMTSLIQISRALESPQFLSCWTYQQPLTRWTTASCYLYLLIWASWPKHILWILPHWTFFQCVTARTNIYILSPLHRGAPRLGGWAPSITHHLLGSNYPLARLLISYSHRRYPTIPVIPTRGPHGVGMDLGLSLRYVHMDATFNVSSEELLVIPANQYIHHNIIIKIAPSSLTPTKVCEEPVMTDDHLSFSDHVAALSRLCRFALYHISS